MARYDKYEPNVGGFRALLEDAWLEANIGIVLGSSLNASGRVILTGGQTGWVGVLVMDRTRPAGHSVDTMTFGEIVDVEGLVAGTVYYVQADGTVSDVVTRYKVGHTVEADRLVVRFTDLGAVPV